MEHKTIMNVFNVLNNQKYCVGNDNKEVNIYGGLTLETCDIGDI